MSQNCNCGRCYHGYTGSGILIVDSDTKQLILCRDTKSKKYSDFGGIIDTKQLNQQGHTNYLTAITASKELAEESRMVLSINPKTLGNVPYVSVNDGKDHNYKCYIVHLKGLKGICTKYYEAKQAIRSKPREYHETDMMTRFPLADVCRQYRENGRVNNMIIDDKGHSTAISGRLRRVLEAWCKKGI